MVDVVILFFSTLFGTEVDFPVIETDSRMIWIYQV